MSTFAIRLSREEFEDLTSQAELWGEDPQAFGRRRLLTDLGSCRGCEGTGLIPCGDLPLIRTSVGPCWACPLCSRSGVRG